MRTFRDVVDEQARRAPSAPFLIAPEPQATLTYEALRRSARSFAAQLDALGVPPRSIVGFMLPNGGAAACIFLSAMYGGQIVMPINLVAQDAHLDHVLRHAAPAIIFVAPDFEARLRAAIERTGAQSIVQVVPADGVEAGAHRECDELTPIEPSSPAMLMYTSGTTGMPKGVLLSHANMICAGEAVASAQSLTGDDRVLSSLPLYHINGQCIATIAPLVSGGSIVMPHRFSVSQWWGWVERYRPTWLNVVPTIIAYLLHGPELTPEQRNACGGIRFVRSASAPLPPHQHRDFEARFGLAVLEALGLTECASVAFANPLDSTKRKIGSVGIPLAVEARIMRDGAVRTDGTPGEIQVRGPNVMLGYFRAPAETAKAIDASGWLATGDLGYRDADGFYFVTGRLKELIIKGGENIAPREIDEALLRHPAVLEGAAVGIPDEEYGQEIFACVVLKPDHVLTESELRLHCERELGRFKTPKLLRFVAELPKGPSGKVQRLKLGELLS
jgi:long-chain acyl-CoA synthetase